MWVWLLVKFRVNLFLTCYLCSSRLESDDQTIPMGWSKHVITTKLLSMFVVFYKLSIALFFSKPSVANIK